MNRTELTARLRELDAQRPRRARNRHDWWREVDEAAVMYADTQAAEAQADLHATYLAREETILDLRASLKDLGADYAERGRILAELRADLGDVRAQIASLTAERDRLQDLLVAERDHTRGELTAAGRLTADLRRELAEAQTRGHELGQIITSLRAECDRLAHDAQQCARLERDLAGAREALAAITEPRTAAAGEPLPPIPAAAYPPGAVPLTIEEEDPGAEMAAMKADIDERYAPPAAGTARKPRARARARKDTK